MARISVGVSDVYVVVTVENDDGSMTTTNLTPDQAMQMSQLLMSASTVARSSVIEITQPALTAAPISQPMGTSAP